MTTTGTVRSVQRVALGSTLDADAASGATTITVSDTVDFNIDLQPGFLIPSTGGAAWPGTFYPGTTYPGELGGGTPVAIEALGTVSIGDVLYVYTAVDEDTGVITLAGPLTAASSDGDRVDIWDPTAAAIASEYRALIDLPGDVDDGDSVDALVELPVVPLLPEGLRQPGQGETVTLEQRDGEWVVIDAPGTTPQLAGELVRPGSVQLDSLGFDLPDGTKVRVATTAPADPLVDDVWVYVDLTDPSNNTINRWDGTAWVPFVFGTDAIAAGSITAELLAADSIIAGKIAAGALDAFSIVTATLSAATLSGHMVGAADPTDPGRSRISGTDFLIDNDNGRLLVYSQVATTALDSTTPGSAAWTATVTGNVKVECWGSGGGGGGGGSGTTPLGHTFGSPGAGGPGGEYACEPAVPVTSGTAYAYTVPAGGSGRPGGSEADPSDGADATFAGDSGVVVHAHGGQDYSGGSGSTNSVRFAGGDAGLEYEANLAGHASAGGGGGGGSGATPVAAGANGKKGTSSTGGAGGTKSGGGPGGAGAAISGSPVAGSAPGGGGGGGRLSASLVGGDGAAGGAGRVKVTTFVTVLLASFAAQSGTDSFGNTYPAGIMVYPSVTTDWDSAQTPGTYSSVAGSGANSPDSSKAWTGEVYGRLGTGSLVQVVHRLSSSSDNAESWIRQYGSSGGWQPWHQFAYI